MEVPRRFDISEKAPENEGRGDSKPLQTYRESKPADCAKNAAEAHALDRLAVKPESKPLPLESVHEAAQEERHESSFRCSELTSMTTPRLRSDKPERSFETETLVKAGKLDSARKSEEPVQKRDQFERTSVTKQDCAAKRIPEKQGQGDLKEVESLRLESKSEKLQSEIKSQKAVEDKDRLANNSDKQSNCPPQQLLREEERVDSKPLEVAGKAKQNLEGFKAVSSHPSERQGDVPEQACMKDEQMNTKDSQSPKKSPENIHNGKTLKSPSDKSIPSSESQSSSSEGSESGSSTLESDSSSPSSAEVVIATTALMMKDDEGPMDKAALRTKNEQNVNDIEIKKPTIQVTAAHKLLALGKVSGVMDKTVIIMSTEAEKAKSSGMPCVESERDIAEASALDSGSIVCFGDRTVLGEIFETFGQVRSPYYIIRFNNEEEISEVNAKVGRDVFYVPELSKTVRAKDVHIKGYDSSNFFDEEVGNKEFSDDEAEAEARRSRKRARQGGLPTSLSAKSIQRGAVTPKRFMPRQRLQNEKQGWRTRSQSAYVPGRGGDGFNPNLGPTAPHMSMSATGAAASNGAFHRGQPNHGSWGGQRGNEFENRMVNAVHPPNAMRHGNARVAPNNAYSNSMYTPSALMHQPGAPWVNGGQTYQGSPNSAMVPHGPYPGGRVPFPAPNGFLPYNQPPTQFQGTPIPPSTYSPQWAGMGNAHPSSSIQGQPLQYPTGPNSQMYPSAPIIYPPGAYNYPQSSFVPETPPPNFPAPANDFPRPPHK
ncbi:unnamed protein product [Chondrus crispus]|uniref:H/ACA ribonucleoprotein complex non-core subunit NAF1 n=1 Tax=Chondrus crispus TaxID=2769 RepID=R7QEQ3_CHOCR|nr:unnamed protein product [Chondrus crispus]CDF35936.1 unnamed protein product [Chondrus crispus]|eukprot:XP_005715755.1 unnamed protein product [Chondrus crispus]